jgi:hypothetical protein
MAMAWAGVALAVGSMATLWAVLRSKSKRSAPLSTKCLYINADGSARELHPSEREYLDTPFRGDDGNRPRLKRSYSEKDGWGEISGFMERSKLPLGYAIGPAPQQEPATFKPLTQAELIQFLRDKGVEVTECPDGSYVIPTQEPEVIAKLRSRRRSNV